MSCQYNADGSFVCQNTPRQRIFSNVVEHFENGCYGADNAKKCNTCAEVIKAYSDKKWKYDTKNFVQCKEQCYGARPTDDCVTCKDVIGAFVASKPKNMDALQYILSKDPSKFSQCTTCQMVIDAYVANKLPVNHNQIPQCIKTVTNKDGSVTCDKYCQGTGGKSWNSELPQDWNGAKCFDTNNTAAGCYGIPGKPIQCKCVRTGAGWFNAPKK